MFKSIFAAAAFLAVIALPTPAFAHPRLVSSTPAAEATVSKPGKIALNFSEQLVAPLTGIELTMTAMPGMANHKPMPVTGFKTEVKGKTLTATLPRPLPNGTYLVKWHAVAADQHRIEGSFSFKVG